MEDFIQTKNGKDTGDEFTWREALKTHALADHHLNSFPVYLAHCNMAGGEYALAAKIYGDLYEMADTQGDSEDWYRCYLSYSAGEA
ncbi:MAG: hypothetical protein KKF30_09285 [Proteobacteria bacterium]|nr:hypothetical protein [Pseudomonadota bacterium]MBU4470566.1 hypothetical protein [Pseudomonadota bacterium]MCG2751402.1 hypothetical protein [Desulfobacteraceae bacterium]